LTIFGARFEQSVRHPEEEDMSVVTGLVLVCSVGELLNWAENQPGNIPSVNQWLSDRNFEDLKELADTAATGNKHPQLLLYAAGYNHFPEDEFIDFFRNLQWESPERVVLVLQPEDGATRVIRPEGCSAG
jgi:hypothetical protein